MRLAAIPIALVAAAVGAWFYFYHGAQFASPFATSESTTPAVTIPFTQLVSGTLSNVAESKNYLVESSAQLQQLWKLIKTATPPPTIDFSKNVVIAVFAGSEPTPGYAVIVSKIEDSAKRLVTITLTAPDSSCVLPQMVTSPYELIEVPATTLPLTHQDIASTTGCLQ